MFTLRKIKFIMLWVDYSKTCFLVLAVLGACVSSETMMKPGGFRLCHSEELRSAIDEVVSAEATRVAIGPIVLAGTEGKKLHPNHAQIHQELEALLGSIFLRNKVGQKVFARKSLLRQVIEIHKHQIADYFSTAKDVLGQFKGVDSLLRVSVGDSTGGHGFVDFGIDLVELESGVVIGSKRCQFKSASCFDFKVEGEAIREAIEEFLFLLKGKKVGVFICNDKGKRDANADRIGSRFREVFLKFIKAGTLDASIHLIQDFPELYKGIDEIELADFFDSDTVMRLGFLDRVDTAVIGEFEGGEGESYRLRYLLLDLVSTEILAGGFFVAKTEGQIQRDKRRAVEKTSENILTFLERLLQLIFGVMNRGLGDARGD